MVPTSVVIALAVGAAVGLFSWGSQRQRGRGGWGGGFGRMRGGLFAGAFFGLLRRK